MTLNGNNQGRLAGPSTQKGHLHLAARFAADTWFPSDPLAPQRILELLRGKQESAVILAELKSDYSLFMYCIRRLAETRSQANDHAHDPVKLLVEATPHELEGILTEVEHKGWPHALGGATTQQVHRLQDAMISATASELMAAPRDIDPLTAYTTALFRQLGVTLISWNYPHVYKRILTNSKDGEGVDLQISRTLGFGPNVLALTLARQWNLSPTLIASLGGITRAEQTDDPMAARIARLCATAEALTLSCRYAKAAPLKKSWQDAHREFELALGPDSFRRLRQGIAKNLGNYSRLMPQAFVEPASLVTFESQEQERPSGASLLAKNIYAARCPKPAQEILQRYYHGLTPGAPTAEKLELISQRLVPALGFERGAIFLFDQESQSLAPRYLLGSPPKQQYTQIICTDADLSPIVPIFRSGSIREGIRGSVTYLGAVLGPTQRAGVLYLELGTQHSDNKQIAFKAILTALNDGLNLI